MIRLCHRLRIVTAALGLGLVCAASARADVVFNDFGPGDAYNTLGGLPVGGSSGGFGQLDISGATFTAASTGTLSEIDVPFFNQSGPGIFNLELHADDGTGKVGALLESFENIGPATASQTIFSIVSTLHPLLTAGDAYWLVATPADPTTAVFWNNNSIGATGTIYEDFNGSVNYAPGEILPTFRVIASASVPEPSSLVLGVSGLAVVGTVTLRCRTKPGRR
jgi:hypothetical protein